MKRLSLQLMGCALAAAVSAVAGLGFMLYASHDAVYFRSGLLPTATDEYLDGSGSTFQKIGWHLGDGTHIWGQTYGLKLRRLYVLMELKHVNPRRTAEEAGD